MPDDNAASFSCSFIFDTDTNLMQASKSAWIGRSLGLKLSVINFVLVSVILLSLVLAIAWGVQRTIGRMTQTNLENFTRVAGEILSSTDAEIRERAQQSAVRFAKTLQGHWVLDTFGNIPQLLLDNELMDEHHSRFAGFVNNTGMIASVFMLHEGRYVRVATNMRNAQGKLITGTELPTDNPAYAAAQAGQGYTGINVVEGRRLMSVYQVLRDDAGKVIGLLYTGMDFSDQFTGIERILGRIPVGKSGYFYVLDNTPGPSQGTVVVHKHQNLKGRNVIDLKDVDGGSFIREILQKREGMISYNYATDEGVKESSAFFGTYEPWNWTYVAMAYPEEFKDEADAMTIMSLVAGLLGIVALSGVWMYLIKRMVVRPLREANRVTQAVAQGDLRVRADVRSEDEVGQLLASLNDTAQGLGAVVRTVRSRAEMVATASAEIAQGNQDLSNRTESQASALEETAAAMEELGSTVAHNADHAKTADQLTQEVQRVVTEGGAAVRAVVHTMQGIDESGKKIGDIIGVIDGIAFQTNILALNAAVEAARAGEHGRGFAVVAAEVRSLAGRSAEAAKEIKQLITTNVSEIEQGNVRATRAGETMEQAIAEIRKVTSLISDISHASVEQANGVAQAAEAVTNMDQTTQQNAAMVEEMAASAQTLRQQSDELVQAVSIFKIEGSHGGGYSSSAYLGSAGGSAASSAATATAPAKPAASARPAALPAAVRRPGNTSVNAAAGGITGGASSTTSSAKASPAPKAVAAAPRSESPTPVAPPPAVRGASSEDDWESF